MIEDLINRFKNLQKFEISRKINGQLQINGVIPFDLKINNTLAIITLVATSKEEAELKVDEWLKCVTKC